MASFWDRTKQTLERTLEEGQKATQRLVESAGEVGGAAKARLDQAMVERQLTKQLAELGGLVYEKSKAAKPRSPFSDPKVKDLLAEIRKLDVQLAEMRLAED